MYVLKSLCSAANSWIDCIQCHVSSNSSRAISNKMNEHCSSRNLIHACEYSNSCNRCDLGVCNSNISSSQNSTFPQTRKKSLCSNMYVKLGLLFTVLHVWFGLLMVPVLAIDNTEYRESSYSGAHHNVSRIIENLLDGYDIRLRPQFGGMCIFLYHRAYFLPKVPASDISDPNHVTLNSLPVMVKVIMALFCCFDRMPNSTQTQSDVVIPAMDTK